MANARRAKKISIPFLIAAAFIGMAGCKKNYTVQQGMAVKMNYTLNVDGKVVDTSQGKEPLSYVQGSGQIIPGLENELVGLKVGDKKHVTVTPEKGYGPINPKAQQKVPIKVFGNAKDLKVGMVVSGQSNGRSMQAKVLAISPTEVTLDLNHPLAGKTLNFDIEIVQVMPAPPAPAGPPPMSPSGHP